MAKAVEEEFGWQGTDTHLAIRREVEKDLSDRHAVATFDQVIKYGTGVFMGPYAWGLQKERNRILEEHTAEMVAALEEHGERARYVSNTVRKSLVTGEVVEVEALRNICFFPTVAQKNRRDFINDLGYFMENVDANQGKYHKYFVLTFGRRQDLVAFGDMGGAIDAANKKMQRWREMAEKEFGIIVHMTALEWTVDKDRTYHLHANVLAKTPFMVDAKEQFARFAARSEEILGGKFLNAGAIRNLREVIKYPFKPVDMKGASSAELFWLFQHTFKRRIIRFHGDLARFRRDRKEDGHRVFKLRNKFRLREVAPILPHENGYSEVDLERLEQQKQLEAYCEEHQLEPPERGEDGTNILLAKVAPNFEHSMWAEPSVLIMNYQPEPDEFDKKGHQRLETLSKWSEEAREAWDASGAPDPATALTMAQAAALGPKNAHNIRALWKSAGPQATFSDVSNFPVIDPRLYVVHNGTVSPAQSSLQTEDVLDDWNGDPPGDPDYPGKVIKFPSKPSENTQTAQADEEDIWFMANSSDFVPEVRDFDDVPF